MKPKINNIINKMKLQKMIVVRVTKTEFELDNGDIYPHTFELDEDITIDEFQMLLNESQSTMINHLNKIIKANE